MADLNLRPELLNLIKSHCDVENGRSELKSGALKNGVNEFEINFLAFSRQVVPLLFGWPSRVGRVVSAVCFFVLILNNAPALRAGNK